jgi:hypothetical protein
MTNEKFLKDYLYRVIQYTDPGSGTDKLILAIGGNIKRGKYLSPLSTELEEEVLSIDVVDINESIMTDSIHLCELFINDTDKFVESVNKISDEDITASCEAIKYLIEKESQSLSERIKNYNKTLCVIQKIIGQESVSDNAVIISNGANNMFATMVYNTIDGIKKDLSSSQMNDIGNIILQELLDNSDVDTKDNKAIDRIANRLELKIIESCPSWMITGKININKDSIISEINRLQEMSSDSNEFE